MAVAVGLGSVAVAVAVAVGVGVGSPEPVPVGVGVDVGDPVATEGMTVGGRLGLLWLGVGATPEGVATAVIVG